MNVSVVYCHGNDLSKEKYGQAHTIRPLTCPSAGNGMGAQWTVAFSIPRDR